jgi:hypothetical protein
VTKVKIFERWDSDPTTVRTVLVLENNGSDIILVSSTAFMDSSSLPNLDVNGIATIYHEKPPIVEPGALSALGFYYRRSALFNPDTHRLEELP